MKKTILAALAALTLATGAWSMDNAQWKAYNDAKPEAQAALADLKAGNTSTAALNRALSAFAAVSTAAAPLNREDVLGWQYNNSAFAAITWFQHAGYTKAMHKLEVMPAGKTKPAAIAATKAELLPLFETIEAGARAALQAAKDTGYQNPEFLGTVRSNEGFLNWVRNFLDKK